MENQQQPTFWQKMSVFILTGVVLVSILVCQWLFGMLYPQDSYREYSNWQIQEMTTDHFLTAKGIDELAAVIDRKDTKTLWVDRINRLAFDSAGQLTTADLEILAVDEQQQALRFHFTLTKEDEQQAKLIRQQGYITVEGTQQMVPYEVLYTLCNHPMEELANQLPIANQSTFWIIGLGEDREKIPQQETSIPIAENGWLIRTQPLRLEHTEGRTGQPQGNTWFVRRENGWFSVTDWNQVSPDFVALDVVVYSGQEDETSVSLADYGTLLLES